MTRNEYIALSALKIMGGNVEGRTLYWAIVNLMPWYRRWFYGYGPFYLMMRELSGHSLVTTVDWRDVRDGDRLVRSYCITDDGRKALEAHLRADGPTGTCC